jgi:uncharacterized protein YgiM (DUF1202 family)
MHVWLVLCAFTAAAVSPLPGEIADDEAPIRCGPGTQYYACLNLPAGTRVEIYEQRDDGWLAIRPPEGSFSWVDSQYVRKTDNPVVGQITQANTPAWIGSRLNAASEHRWQVRLKKNEFVQILGQVQAEGAKPNSLWYRIAPPAGEFRWVHQTDVNRLSRDMAPSQTVAEQAGGTHVQKARYRDVGESRAATSVDRAEHGEHGLSSTKQTLNELSLRLTLLAAEDPQSWHLQPLKHAAIELVDSGATAVQRGQARLLLERINEFEAVKRRLHRMRIEEKMPVRAPAQSNSFDDLDPLFDGMGLLSPVHSSREGAPPFALLDQTGTVRFLVSPAPGVNLRRYAKKQVGVLGERSFSESYMLMHIRVERVVELPEEK